MDRKIDIQEQIEAAIACLEIARNHDRALGKDEDEAMEALIRFAIWTRDNKDSVKMGHTLSKDAGVRALKAAFPEAQLIGEFNRDELDPAQ